jgi:folate-binding Fe-S cluster repair protein YgfZ
LYRQFSNLGCYIGQELISRAHHTGVVRRRVVPFECAIRNQIASVGNLFDQDKKRQGKVICAFEDRGLALTSPDLVGRPLFDENNISINISKPKWWI